ncbi:MAG: aminotransferase class I/II-fold pyridoxal phosphate-dependent enzyme [Acidobacteria bacterium]|nr:aminotransferase class I/II-fold pyridoxal phosphate-dependent enzyme [Acidobacteriota bacterium]
MSIPSFDSTTRRFAHDLVDFLFDHVERVDERPVVDWTPAEDLRRMVRLDLPHADGIELARLVAEKSIQLHHPSYMGHQVCPPSPIAILGDLLISTLNQSTAVSEMSPIGTVIEKEIVRWLATLAGYGEEAEGTMVSGGSAANLTALLAARAKRGSGAVLVSADTHYSMARAAAIMGLEDVVKIETDDHHRMSVNALARELAKRDRVMAIVATAGSTATGAFDDLEAIADLRDRHDTWLHVDSAHGASVLLSERLAPLAKGLHRADSLSWDPHKMLWMPVSLGAVLVRDGIWLRRAFQADAPYLFHAEREAENLGAMTIQCSKRADAIKLWLSLRMHGPRPFAEAIECVTDVTRYLYERVNEIEELEAMHEPELNIFCFRHRSGDEVNHAIREKLIRGGTAWITSTVLKGQRVLRVTMINPRTTRAHVDRMLEDVLRLAR